MSACWCACDLTCLREQYGSCYALVSSSMTLTILERAIYRYLNSIPANVLSVWFSGVFREYKIETLVRNRLICLQRRSLPCRETNQRIYKANQSTGFYMMKTLVGNGWNGFLKNIRIWSLLKPLIKK